MKKLKRMKKILIMIMTISLFMSNLTNVTYAYTANNLKADSKFIVTTTLEGQNYKKYRTTKKIGQTKAGAMYYVDSKNNIVTNLKTIKKLEIINLARSNKFKKNTKENRDLYSQYIKDVATLKKYIKFAKFQTTVIALGVNPTKFFDSFKSMSLNTFKENLNPMVGLVKYATSELEKGVEEFDKALNVKSYTYENSLKALESANKAYGYAYSMAIINKWCNEIEKNVSFKNLIKALTLGFQSSISDLLNSLGYKELFENKMNEFIKETAKKFGIDEKDMKELYNGIKNANKTKSNSQKYSKQINDLYQKTALYSAVNNKKQATIKDKIVTTSVYKTAEEIYNWSVDLNTYTKFTINSVKSTSISVSGKGLAKATVKAYVGKTQIGKTSTVNSNGNYKIAIPKQSKGKKITIKMTSGKKIFEKTVTVK